MAEYPDPRKGKVTLYPHGGEREWSTKQWDEWKGELGVEVVPASFTDEDVERVAEALDPGAFTGPHVESQDWKNRRYDARTKGRRALSAYLEPTTKGDT